MYGEEGTFDSSLQGTEVADFQLEDSAFTSTYAWDCMHIEVRSKQGLPVYANVPSPLVCHDAEHLTRRSSYRIMLS